MTSCDAGDIPDDDVIDPDSDILDMEPLVQPRPRYGRNSVPLMYLITLVEVIYTLKNCKFIVFIRTDKMNWNEKVY